MFRHVGWEHAGVLLFYTLLSIALSWPLARYFTTHIAGGGLDALHNLWLLWHTQQAFQGNQPLFGAPLLFYPEGISLLIHGLGPVMGVFALPFWAWGPEAAHNGAVLVGLCLTGYCMYLLGRSLGLDHSIALFAGMMLITAPMCLAGIFGHMTKVFLGGLPLVLLTVQYALNPQRSRWWTITPGLALLVPLLHSGYQFIFAGFALGFFLLAFLVTAHHNQRRNILIRCVFLTIGILALVGPFIIAILIVSSDPAYNITASEQVTRYQPDVALFFLPNYFSRLLGGATMSVAEIYHIRPYIEKTVTLYMTGLLLCILAALRGDRSARPWLLFTVVCVLLAIGPMFKVLGMAHFGAQEISIPLPFGLISAIPGLGFIRAPGRFMMVGFVGFAIAASYGLAWLTRRWPRQRYIIVVGVVVLILVESWPHPFPNQQLPTTAQFYEQMADDDEQYGVLDLPIYPWEDAWYVSYSAIYQIHQMTHHKGIFAGYTSRTYASHPVLPQFVRKFGQLQHDILVNNTPTSPFTNAQIDLAQHGYRYVVWHKQPHLTFASNDWGQQATEDFINAAFRSQAPLVDDEFVQVYAVDPAAETIDTTTPPTIALAEGWYGQEETWRWSVSPAKLHILSPQHQPALLQITPAFIYDPQMSESQHKGVRGVLDVQSGTQPTISAPLEVGTTTTVPLRLAPGRQVITLTLQAGNFAPADYGIPDNRQFSFAIRYMNLQTGDGLALPDDILVNGQLQRTTPDGIVATHGANWSERELADNNWRWGRSPTEVLIYSPTSQRVRLSLTPAWLHMPGEPNGLGEQGIMRVTLNDTPAQELAVRVDQPATTALALQAGWNTVTLELTSGNVRPGDVLTSSGDQHWLSFAVRQIDIMIE